MPRKLEATLLFKLQLEVILFCAAWPNNRRHSVHELAFTEDHNLDKQNKSLAKSYSALPMAGSAERGVDAGQYMRGIQLLGCFPPQPH